MEKRDTGGKSMLTLDKLTAYGADTATGLARCMNNEGFYLRLVNMELSDGNFDKLHTALNAGNARDAFEAAHALKGALGNLALTPLYEPVAQATELLRHADGPVDAGDLPRQIRDAYQRLKALAG